MGTIPILEIILVRKFKIRSNLALSGFLCKFQCYCDAGVCVKLGQCIASRNILDRVWRHDALTCYAPIASTPTVSNTPCHQDRSNISTLLTFLVFTSLYSKRRKRIEGVAISQDDPDNELISHSIT
jgi:hypothetical protein